MRESAIVGQILAYLASRWDVFAWRNNSGGAWIRGQLVRFGSPGSADIIGVMRCESPVVELAPRGQFLAIEVKSARGAQSAAQARWQAEVERRGGLYVLARSVEDVRRALS